MLERPFWLKCPEICFQYSLSTKLCHNFPKTLLLISIVSIEKCPPKNAKNVAEPLSLNLIGFVVAEDNSTVLDENRSRSKRHQFRSKMATGPCRGQSPKHGNAHTLFSHFPNSLLFSFAGRHPKKNTSILPTQ